MKIELDNAGIVGIVRDMQRDSMPVEAWDTLRNVRCKEKTIQPLGQDTEVYNDNSLAIRFMHEIRDPASPYWLLATNGKLYKTNGTSAPTDITKLATTYGTGDDNPINAIDYHRHQIVNFSSGSDLPQVMVPGASNMVDLTNWPASTYCKFISTYKDFLFAYNISGAGGTFPGRVMWSAIADPGTLPHTWDPDDLTALAGESDAMERGGGKMMAAMEMNNVNYIYKNNAIWSCRPRNDQYVWTFDQMEPTQGLIGTHAIAQFEGLHYLAISGDIVVNNGHRITSIIDKTLRKWLFDNIHSSYHERTQLIASYVNKELWICFCDKTSTGNLNYALIWNIMDKSFSERELNDFSFIETGVIDTSGVSEIIDDDSGIIDQDSSLIDATSYNPSLEGILACADTTPGIYELDDVMGTLSNILISRQGLTVIGRDRFGEWKLDASTRKQVTRIYPKFAGEGTFNIYVGFGKTVEGAVTWSQAESYTIGSTPHCDYINQGEVLAMKIEPQTTDFWTYSGADIILDVVGESVF